MPDIAADTLFYDGRCPLCRREMGHLARLAGSGLRLQDIHALPDAAWHPEAAGKQGQGNLPAREDLLHTLHLRCADGTWVRGADANVRAWQHTRIGFLWALLRLPGIRALVDRAYAYWADRRYEKLYGPEGRLCRERETCY
jgi:predicted DCC family thiol-disulfide oxidoreductase YuxK